METEKIDQEEISLRHWNEFSTRLCGLINSTCMDCELGVPDFILRDFVVNILENLKDCNEQIRKWHGKE